MCVCNIWLRVGRRKFAVGVLCIVVGTLWMTWDVGGNACVCVSLECFLFLWVGLVLLLSLCWIACLCVSFVCSFWIHSVPYPESMPGTRWRRSVGQNAPCDQCLGQSRETCKCCQASLIRRFRSLAVTAPQYFLGKTLTSSYLHRYRHHAHHH